MREFGIGSPVPRVEDDQLLRGFGRYVSDIELSGALVMHVVRSPYPAARIARLDAAAALAAPGVVAVLTQEDILAAGLAAIGSKVPHVRPDGSPHSPTPYRALAVDVAPHAGDAVAAIVAETVNQAKDAAELIEVDYEPLPFITDTWAAAQPDAPRVWQDLPDNVCFLREIGDRPACDAAFAQAHRVVSQRFTLSRVSASPLEPRGAIGVFNRRSNTFTLYSGLQMPHESGRDIASAFGLAPSDIHVISPDIGGGFGMKLPVYQEYLLVLLAARKVGRPVKWIGDRSESFLSDQQARDNISDVELALDQNGAFLGLRVRTIANLGAYIGQWSLHVPTGNLGGLAGVYRIPAFDVSVTGVFSNTVPVGAFRGAGRPEASYCLERIIDRAALAMGLDPAELRRRNMIDAEQMPYDTGLVFTYDSGDFKAVLDRTLREADWGGFEARRLAALERGKLRGIGLAYVIEIAGGPPGKAFDEHVEIRFDSAGKATVLAGTHSHGQGHETAYRQLAAEYLALPFDQVRVVCGDTELVSHGRGSFGSRSMMAGGAAFRSTADKIIAKGRRIAAHKLGAAQDDIHFADGLFIATGTNRSMSLKEVSQLAFNPFALPDGIEVGLHASSANSEGGCSFPNGCHICEIEIDRDTGLVSMIAYHVGEDVGTVINPLLLKGQIHGGVVQGAGQALMERVVYGMGDGQLVTGSFMDYAMPRAGDTVPMHVLSHPVPTTSNPLGVKGAGEAGAVGALPAVMNAVGNALWHAGVPHIEMPASSSRVWQALCQAASHGTGRC